MGAAGDEPYFVDDIDRITWIRRLVAVLDRHHWTCVVFCQLTTHVHVIVDVADQSLPVGMQRLNSDYGRYFNDRHDRRGHLQRARYWSKPKQAADQLLAAYRYVARNPIEAGLARDPFAWRWSSVATSCGTEDAYPFVDASAVAVELPSGTLRDFVAAPEDTSGGQTPGRGR